VWMEGDSSNTKSRRGKNKTAMGPVRQVSMRRESAPTASGDHPGLVHAGDSNTPKQTQTCNEILRKTSFLSKKSGWGSSGVDWGSSEPAALVAQEVSSKRDRSAARGRAGCRDQGTGRKSLRFCSEKIFQALMFPSEQELTAAPCSPQVPCNPTFLYDKQVPCSVRSLEWKHLEAPSIHLKFTLLQTPEQAGLFFLHPVPLPKRASAGRCWAMLPCFDVGWTVSGSPVGREVLFCGPVQLCCLCQALTQGLTPAVSCVLAIPSGRGKHCLAGFGP